MKSNTEHKISLSIVYIRTQLPSVKSNLKKLLRAAITHFFLVKEIN